MCVFPLMAYRSRWMNHESSSWIRTVETVDRTAVSLGNFDGVHLGHRAILEKTIDLARKSNIPTVAVTFDPVPKKILQPKSAPPLIQTLQQRLSKLESLGLDHTIVVKFSEEFARKTPEEFVRQFLIETLKVKHFVVGENFSFGHQKRGDLSLLKKMGAEMRFSGGRNSGSLPEWNSNFVFTDP